MTPTSRDIRARIEYAAAMAGAGVPTDVIEDTLRDSRSLHMLAEHDCNVGLTERDSKRVELLEARTAGKLAAYGFETMFQGDPRGAIVLVRRADVRGDWFGGDGWLVVPSH